MSLVKMPRVGLCLHLFQSFASLAKLQLLSRVFYNSKRSISLTDLPPCFGYLWFLTKDLNMVPVDGVHTICVISSGFCWHLQGWFHIFTNQTKVNVYLDFFKFLPNLNSQVVFQSMLRTRAVCIIKYTSPLILPCFFRKYIAIMFIALLGKISFSVVVVVFSICF